MGRRSSIDFALRCYPKWWRDRYVEEMRAAVDDLTGEGRSSSLIAFSLLRDAARSHLQARGMPRTYGLLAARTKTSITTATIPWLVVVPFITFVTSSVVLHSNSGVVQTGFPFQFNGGVGVFSRFSPRIVHPPMSVATWVVGFAGLTLGVLFLATLLVLAFGWRSLRSDIRHSPQPNQRWLRILSWLPDSTVWLVFALWVVHYYVGPRSFFQHGNGPLVQLGGNPELAVVLGDLTWVVAIVGWSLSMVGIAALAKGAELPPETLRYGRTVSVLTAISMSLSFVAFAAWGIALSMQTHQPVVAGAITAAYPHQTLWLPTALVLALAVVISLWGATNARRSWRVISAQRLWEST
jgi:hypothetical protein